MHVHAYRLSLEPTLSRPAVLTPEAVADRLAEDAIVQQLVPLPSGPLGAVVSVVLRRDRESHEEALNELLIGAQELGYAFVEAEITKVADRAIEMAVGLGVGGLIPGSTTENPQLAVIGGVIGWIAGLLVGANMEKAEVLYRAQWTPEGWSLSRVEPVPAAPVRARPALGTV